MMEENFSKGSSILHKADPGMKMIGFFFPALSMACGSSLPVLYAGLLCGLGLSLLARLPLRMVCKQLAGVNLFLACLWLILPLSGSSVDPAFHLGPVALSRHGIDLAHLVTVKANAITLFILSLPATSSVTRIGNSLERLGFSRKFTLLLVSSFRYLGVIRQEYLRLRRAADLRCFRPATNLHTYRTIGYLIGMTLAKSHQQAGRIHNAMLMRGFSGTFPSMDRSVIRSSDYLLAGALAGLGLILAFAGHI